MPTGNPFEHYHSTFDVPALIRKYAQSDIATDVHCVSNFLGVRVPAYVHHANIDKHKNTVEPLPIPNNWHADMAEWAAALKTVDDAKGTYRIIEVGCGWGCWLVNMGAAARIRGLNVQLIGIEGEVNILKKADKVLKYNGFSSDDYALYHGVAASNNDGAIFPLGLGYGATPIFSPSARQRDRYKDSPDHLILESYTLEDLSNSQTVDLLHVDIQGSEVSFIKDNWKQIERYVSRILIGTHAREIEGRLFDHFASTFKWSLEVERPAILSLDEDTPKVKVDGVQMWRNPNAIASS